MAQEMARKIGQDIAPAEMLSLPVWAASRIVSLGTVKLQGQPETSYLSAGLPELSGQERAEINRRLARLEVILKPGQQDDRRKLALIARMLLSFPAAGMSEKGAEMRGETYLFVLDDVPAWAVETAVRAWLRGETGILDGLPAESIDYRWAPAPAILRRACFQILRPYRDVELKLRKLLEAKRLDEILGAADKREKPPLNWPPPKPAVSEPAA
jgi:hypothetical protein